MKLAIYNTITEALGFAWHKYDTAARLAWVPLMLFFVLSIAEVYLYLSLATGDVVTIFGTSYLEALGLVREAVAAVAESNPLLPSVLTIFKFILFVVIISSFLVPMIRYAARNTPPSGGSFHFSFTWRQLRFIGAQALVFLGVAVLTYVPMQMSLYFIDSYVENVTNNPFAVFPDTESLHTIELQERNPLMANLFGTALAIMFPIFMIYLSLRLFGLPIFTAVREKGETYNSFDLSFKITKGWNTLRLLLILIVIAILTYIVSFVLNAVIVPMITAAINAIYQFVQSVSGLLPADEKATDNIGSFYFLYVIIVYILNMGYLIFVYGLYAGLGGSLFRHGEKVAAAH